jgi:hypothetical protein
LQAEERAEAEYFIEGIRRFNKRKVAWIERLMRRRARHWTAQELARLQEPGKYCVHPNLWLRSDDRANVVFGCMQLCGVAGDPDSEGRMTSSFIWQRLPTPAELRHPLKAGLDRDLNRRGNSTFLRAKLMTVTPADTRRIFAVVTATI